MESLVILLIAGVVYFLPTIVAVDRHVPNTGAVFVINLLLGWTLLGWVVALAMAARTVPPAHLEQWRARRAAQLEAKRRARAMRDVKRRVDEGKELEGRDW